MMNYDEMDHHDEHQWINGLVKYRQFPEISYIFSIYVLYIYICVLYFMGKKPWIPVKSFPSTNPSAQCYQPSGVGRRQRRAEGEGKSGSSSVYGRSVFFFFKGTLGWKSIICTYTCNMYTIYIYIIIL